MISIKAKPYPILLTACLLLVAGSSAYMSIYGLMSVFMNNAIVVTSMGLGMETGKILIVSYTYRHWKNLTALSRIFYIMIVFVLVFLTSIEVMGFLSQSHIMTSRELRISETAIKGLQKEASILSEQISNIENTLAGLPASYVTRRIHEQKAFGYDQKQVRLLEIVKQQAELEAEMVIDRDHAGPVFAVARIINIYETTAIALFILVLVLVLEPLSIGLTLFATAAWMEAHKEPELKPKPCESNEELINIQKEYNLSVAQILRITGRKKPITCKAWLDSTTPMPEKALRAVKTWAKRRHTSPPHSKK